MARDRFKATVTCPVCGKTGVAELSQDDGWGYVKGNRSTDIDHVPDGFTAFNVEKPKPLEKDYGFSCTDHPTVPANIK